MAGRKSLKDELQMFKRYSELSVLYFKVLKESLDSSNKADKKWAVEQLTKAFVKMIPQDLTTGGEQMTPAIINIVAPDGSNIQTVTQTIPSVAVPDGPNNN